MSQANIGFIVVGWNNENILGDCLESIALQNKVTSRTIYVDNDSKDNSVEIVRKKFPWVEIIRSPVNVGFAAGNNLAIAELLKDENIQYIALLNSDARLSQSWTEELLEYATRKPKGAMYQGKTLDFYDQEIVDSTHIYIAQNGQGTQGSWRDLNVGHNVSHKVFGVNFAACMISRKFIEEQPFKKLLDESFFMYLEDVDLSARATVMGWDNYFVPDAVALHMGSISANKNPGFSLYMTYRNNLAMLIKNYTITSFLRMLPKILKSDLDTVRGLLKKRRYLAVRKLVSGRIVGVFRLPLYIGKTWKMHSFRIVNKRYLSQLMKEGKTAS
jgi:GT2 family glycosyltransferase